MFVLSFRLPALAFGPSPDDGPIAPAHTTHVRSSAGGKRGGEFYVLVARYAQAMSRELSMRGGACVRVEAEASEADETRSANTWSHMSPLEAEQLWIQ